MPVDLKVPSVGESITEVQIGDWLKSEGDAIGKDENVVTLESEKATVDLPSPVGGRLLKILKQKGDAATVGEVIAQIEEGGSATAAPSRKGDEAPKAKPTPKGNGSAQSQEAAPKPPPNTAAAPPKPAEEPRDGGPPPKDVRVMPAAQRALAEEQLQPGDVKPTGPGGRLLKEDVQRHVEQQPDKSAPAETPSEGAEAPSVQPSTDRQEEIVPMTLLRRTVAKRLVEAQHTAALLTTFNEIDMSAVMGLRKQFQEAFQEKYQIKLGFMSFFVKAVVEALKATPQLNAEVRGTDIVYRNYYDIGVAIGSGKGLVVPVLRNAERLSFADIEKAIADLAGRAQKNKLKLEELQGGTFTISNGGVYGSLLSTPIVNPPQSGILGMHTIQERPIALEGNVVIRPMMYVALTYDHRVVDGREAVIFLRRVKDVIEQPARMLVEV